MTAAIYVRGDRRQVMCAVDTGTVIAKGNLVRLVTDDVRPFSGLSDSGTKAQNQAAARNVFLGVAMRASADGETLPIPVATAGVFEFNCVSASFEVGDLVGPIGTGTASAVGVSDDTVESVANASLAIGRVFKRGTSVTRVQVEVASVQYARATAVTGGLPRNIGTWQPIAATSGTDTACSDGTAYVGSVYIPSPCTITGIQYLIGSVGGTTKVVVSLHDSAGVVLANSATAGTTVGTAANLQQVAFTAPYLAAGGTYFIGLTFDGTTAKFRSVPAFCNSGSGVIGNGMTQTFGTPATFTAPTTFTADKVPVASVY